jgi:ribonuclease HI
MILTRARASASIFRQLSTYVPPTFLDIYTDGSCVNNGKIWAKGGIGVFFPNNEYKNLSEAYSTKTMIYPPTSQRCELVAIHKALAIHTDHFSNLRCRIYTDSDYAIRCLISYSDVWNNNGWKKTNGEQVRNLDLLKPMISLYKMNSKNISLIFVKAHTGAWTTQALNNNVADALARRGIIV